jgi:hypothetical protein
MPAPNPPVLMLGRAEIAFCAEHGDATLLLALTYGGLIAMVTLDVSYVPGNGRTRLPPVFLMMDVQYVWAEETGS